MVGQGPPYKSGLRRGDSLVTLVGQGPPYWKITVVDLLTRTLTTIEPRRVGFSPPMDASRWWAKAHPTNQAFAAATALSRWWAEARPTGRSPLSICFPEHSLLSNLVGWASAHRWMHHYGGPRPTLQIRPSPRRQPCPRWWAKAHPTGRSPLSICLPEHSLLSNLVGWASAHRWMHHAGGPRPTLQIRPSPRRQPCHAGGPRPALQIRPSPRRQPCHAGGPRPALLEDHRCRFAYQNTHYYRTS